MAGIVGFKEEGGAPLYKVHWQGYSSRQDTWEPVGSLTACGDLIRDYHRRTAAAAAEKAKKVGLPSACTGSHAATCTLSGACELACVLCNDLQITYRLVVCKRNARI